MTMTTFLPQPRTCSRNARSVSVNGRSAEVTNRTRSDRGTNSAVIASCSRMIALVPGVSTMWISRRIGRGGDDVQDGFADLPLERVAVLQHVDLRGRRRDAFLGDRLPTSALMNALLPALNSPTMTSRKSSSS